jgi:hypothetical protein
MIEIKITIDTALALLLERMKFELLLRQRQGVVNPRLKLENISFNEIFKIMEASVFDTVLSLPVDIISSETNLMQIITRTIHSLGKVLSRDEFKIYSAIQTEKLITPVLIYIKKMLKSDNYRNN